MNFKYLIIEHEGLPVPVIFSTLLRHDDMKRFLGLPVVGAGHVKLWPEGHPMQVELCGRAGSLDIEPVPEDAAFIIEDYHRFRGKALSAVMQQIAEG